MTEHHTLSAQEASKIFELDIRIFTHSFLQMESTTTGVESTTTMLVCTIDPQLQRQDAHDTRSTNLPH